MKEDNRTDYEIMEETPTEVAPKVTVEPSVSRMGKILKAEDEPEMKDRIRTLLATPLKDGPVYKVDGSMSLAELSKENTDLGTRIMLKIAFQAAKGDLKAADFLFKYAGYTPPVQQDVTLKIPVIKDDVSR